MTIQTIRIVNSEYSVTYYLNIRMVRILRNDINSVCHGENIDTKCKKKLHRWKRVYVLSIDLQTENWKKKEFEQSTYTDLLLCTNIYYMGMKYVL